MSHLTERKEKNCLNCNAIVQGRYCQVCGQENIVPQESFRHLVLHFIYDITHFDGKFFETLKYLVFKPGFLSAEYMAGRRAKYLNPIRMYVFTSAIFFLIFFAIGSNDVVNFSGDEPFTRYQRDSMIVEIQEELVKNPGDSSMEKMLTKLRDTSKPVAIIDLMDENDGFVIMSTWGGQYKSYREYDSIQMSKTAAERDGWFKRLWNKRSLTLKEKYGNNPRNAIKAFSDSFLHKLPYLLFLSLPLFALILKGLYFRRKHILYAGHGIFTIHHYIFSFLLLLLMMIWSSLYDSTGWGVWNILLTICIIIWPLHLLLSMRRFYKQSWIKTFFKMILLNIAGSITILILFALFVLLSVFQL